MRLQRILPLAALAAILMSSWTLAAQLTTARSRIVERIDESQLTRLSGNTHPLARAKYDTGRVNSDLKMTGLVLVLSRSKEQQAAFDAYSASLYDPNSPNFHKWMTPEEQGANFGPSLSDITTITNWLAGKGFSVDEVAKSHMSIRFSGTAGQVESAFHTEIHNLNVNGELHIANMSDPQIPTALAPAIVGIKALHNFFPRPQHHLGKVAARDQQTGHWMHIDSASTGAVSNTVANLLSKDGRSGVLPQFSINDSTNGQYEDVTPYDFATIYNVAPLWTAGYDGTGQKIAIAGTSGIRTADVATFRSSFGLPTSSSVNTPINISGNNQAVTVCTDTTGKVPYSSNPCELDDQIENALDVEWSGAVAKNAQIVLVSSYPESASDDTLYDSESYIINHVADSTSSVYGAKVMSVSYGLCELGMGTSGNVEYYNLWQTAYTAGIAVFVSTGDTGAAVCDAGDTSSTPALYGTNVNGMASTPYNTAVGGTDFNWGFWNSTDSHATYWNSSNATNGSNAKGYIPEVPWNGTCTNPLILGYMNTQLGTSYSAATMCNDIYTQAVYSSDSNTESWLESLLVPAGGSGGMSNCVANDSSNTSSCASQTTTGSSYGSLTLYADGWPKPSWQSGVTGIPADGVRDLPDVSFFASDGINGSAYLICVSDNHACTYSSTAETTTYYSEVGGTSASTPAMAGVMALINHKAGATQGNPNRELYSLAAAQTYSSCSTESVSSSCYFNDIDTGTIAMPCDYVDLSPNCSGNSGSYVGVQTGYSSTTGYDLVTGLGSLNVYNVANAWSGSTTVSILTPTVTVTPSTQSVSTSTAASVKVTLSGSSSAESYPAGVVSLTAGSTVLGSGTLSSGSYTFTIAAGALSAGSYTLTASYGGDSYYTSGSGTASLTETSSSGSAYSINLSPTSGSLSRSGSTTSASSTISLNSSTSYTGNVSLSCSVSTTLSSYSYAPTCSVSSAKVAMTAGTAASTPTLSVYITTTSALDYPALPGRNWKALGGGAVLALLFFVSVPMRWKKWKSLVGALLLAVAFGLVSGCSGSTSGSSSGGGSSSGTTAGSYTITVTGTGDDSNKTTATATYTLTVGS
jgi:hypothetical protein